MHKKRLIFFIVIFLECTILTKGQAVLKEVILPQNDSLVGKVIDGKKQGKWFVYNNGNQLVRIHQYVDDILNGTTIIFNKNEKVKYIISYKNGLLDGHVYFFSSDEQLIAILKYKDNIRSKIELLEVHDESPPLDHSYVPEW